MGKGERTAYVALPMDVADGKASRRHEEEEGSCFTFAKIGIFAAAVSLVLVGGMHMSCGGKTTHYQKNQLRAHEGRASELSSYWGRIHKDAWGPRGEHNHHGDSLPGPHHAPHGNMLGPDHHPYHDDEIPAVLRHPMHNHGENHAVKHVYHHPNPSDLPEMKAFKKNQEIIKHIVSPLHHDDLPEELQHPHHSGAKLNTVKVAKAEEPAPKHHGDLPEELRHPHHTGKQNTVKVERTEPEDFPASDNNEKQNDVDMPEILRHPPHRANGNGKQGTYVVHTAKGRHQEEPEARDVSSSDESFDDDLTEEELDEILDEELAELEHDFEEDFKHNEGIMNTITNEKDEDEMLDKELAVLEHDFEEDFKHDEEDEDYSDEDDEEEEEEDDDDEFESESEDEDAYESEDEDDFDSEEEDDDDYEDVEDEMDTEILEAFEDFEAEDIPLVEERVEEP